MGILATLSPFLYIHMLHGSYPQRRRSIARETLDLMPALILLPTRKLELEMQGFYLGLQPVDVRSMLKDSMCKLVSMVTNEAFRSTKLVHDMEEGFSYSVHAIAGVKSLCHVGLEKSIGNLKRPYFHNKARVVGVRCMGGVGKTALVLAVCNDLGLKEPCETWQSSKTKLSKGELVSDYHLDGLLRFFDTSIRFPVDKKTCTDVLMYVWVYVRKLEWLKASTIFVELASRNLWNLISKYRSTAATFYGYAADLYFSRYYECENWFCFWEAKALHSRGLRFACWMFFLEIEVAEA